MIRLLSKNEIKQKENADKAREITEGLKISRKVDALRELQAKEEQTLTNFRDESLSVISKEIGDLTTEKELLQSAVDSLRAEKHQGLEILDERKRKLDLLELDIEHRKEVLEEKSYKLQDDERQILVNLRCSNDEMERARTNKERAQQFHIEADSDRKLAGKLMKEATQDSKRIKQESIKDKEKREKSVGIREVKVSTRETECDRREEENITLAEELRIKSIQLEDQRKTLERALKRKK
jgi:hypothetical protein